MKGQNAEVPLASECLQLDSLPSVLALEIFREVSRSLTSARPEDFLKNIPTKACEMLSASVCILWELDEQAKCLRVFGTAGNVSEHFKSIVLSLDAYGVKNCIDGEQVTFLLDVTREPDSYLHPDEARARGWVSLLSVPLRTDKKLVGLLDVYSTEERRFTEQEKRLLASFADLAACALQMKELRRENTDRLADSKRAEKMAQAMLEITQAHDSKQLLRLALKASLALINQPAKGSIGRIDYQTGELVFVVPFENRLKNQRLKFVEGITGRAVIEERPIKVDNVRLEPSYVKVLDSTLSELAVPIIVKSARVRVGKKTAFAPKVVGVLNFESPLLKAFSETDIRHLQTIAEHTALMIERLDANENRERLRQFENRIATSRDYHHTIELVLDGIVETLGFDLVNISLVDPEKNTIETKYLRGLSDEDAEDFKRMAIHSLNHVDIQADIIRSGRIESPDADDPRLDSIIVSRFNHKELIRVYVPMIPSPGRPPIGTVEVGYRKGFRKYIYDSEVQTLKWFVDYAVQALEQKKSGLIDRFSHEFKSPIVGIRNNASFLQRRVSGLPDHLVQNKFEDILTDCEILLQLTRNLEFLLGRTAPATDSKIEKTNVFRDIVIKTINQLKPLVKERGFDWSKIEYSWADSNRIVVWANKASLNQVVYNLLMNSIKYAETDKDEFRIRVGLIVDNRDFILRFSDWGIGVRQGLEGKIFEEGFRAPEAIDKNVTGTGLGLTIARKIMLGLGGELKLIKRYKPTEFHLLLPKKLQEAPE